MSPQGNPSTGPGSESQFLICKMGIILSTSVNLFDFVHFCFVFNAAVPSVDTGSGNRLSHILLVGV